MKYIPLIWAGLWRKRVRTILTILSVVVAFSLYGVMHGVTTGLDDAIEGLTSETRLMTTSRINITEPLPISYAQQILSVEGVDEVVWYGYVGGYFQEPSNQVNTGAVNIGAMLSVYPELVAPPGTVEKMRRTRSGALVGADLADRFGWSVGDVIPLGSSIFTQHDGTSTWDLEIVALYDTSAAGFSSDDLYMNYDYFDESRSFGQGTLALYITSIHDATRSAGIAERIDALFANSTNETQTQNEREWTQAQIAQIGDINFFVNAIVGAVFFTLIFLTGNTMMQSVRERIPELAVLKTYGFGNLAVVALVFAESLILCAVAAGIGLGLAALAFPSVFANMGVIAMPLPASVIALGLGIAGALAVASALPPALRAQRLRIVDALAGR